VFPVRKNSEARGETDVHIYPNGKTYERINRMATKSSRAVRKPRAEPRRLRTAPPQLIELARLARARRTAEAVTQAELGGLAGVGARFVVELEQAKPTLAIGKVIAVLDALGFELRAVPRRGGAG
jgi:y4mF family transcriptional regulator